MAPRARRNRSVPATGDGAWKKTRLIAGDTYAAPARNVAVAACLPINSADCGNGMSCPSDSVCKHGGGCITRTEITQLQADDKAKKEAAAAAQKAAEQKRIEDAKEAARLKEEERQRAIAEQKAEAEAKKAEQARLQEAVHAAALKKMEDDKAAALAKAEEDRRIAAQKKADAEARAAEEKRLKDEARAAALAEAQAKVAEQQKLLDEQKELARLQKQAHDIAAQVDVEKAKAALQAAKANGDVGADLIKLLNQAGTKSGNLVSQYPVITNATFAAIAKVANDPNQAPSVRNLAAWLLQVQKGTAPDGIAGISRPKTNGLSYMDAVVAEAQAHVRALLTQSTNLPISGAPDPSGNAQMTAILNDPTQSVAMRQLSAIALGQDPSTVTQSAPQATPSPQQGIQLNSDVKNDIVTLSPSGSAVAQAGADGTQSNNGVANISSVGLASTFNSPISLRNLTPAGTSVATTSPTQTSALWTRVENAYNTANKLADTDPRFVQGATDINGTIAAAERGAAIGWKAAGPLGIIDGAIIGAKIQSVSGDVSNAQSVLTNVAKGNVIGGLREAVSVGTDKLADKGSDMLFDTATGGAGVASPISLASAIKVDASWGTYFLVSFFSNSSGH